MGKNLVPMIVKKLGLKPYDEFQILYNGGNLQRYGIYRFTNFRMEVRMESDNSDWVEQTDAYLVFHLLTGRETIKKLK